MPSYGLNASMETPVPLQSWTRVGSIRGSGRVGSDYSKSIKFSIRTGRLTADLQQEAATAISLSPSVRRQPGQSR